MNIKSLEAMATALAASIPPHLGRPTIPPIDWHQEGEIVTVILADGRKVSASILEINRIMFEQGVIDKPVETGPAPVPLAITGSISGTKPTGHYDISSAKESVPAKKSDAGSKPTTSAKRHVKK
jgi:hypothetical protein